LNNPARFLDPYHFRVTFECIAPLKDGQCVAQHSYLSPSKIILTGQSLDLEWKLIYVASPGNEELDQELDDCLVGPVPVGVNSFEFEGSAPNSSKIPPEDVLGVAALILTGSYNDQEFVRVGYYQNTEYDNEEMKDALPKPILFDRLVRDINAKPRVTRFQIKWSIFISYSVNCYQPTVLPFLGTFLHHYKRRQRVQQPLPRSLLPTTSMTQMRRRRIVASHGQTESTHPHANDVSRFDVRNEGHADACMYHLSYTTLLSRICAAVPCNLLGSDHPVSPTPIRLVNDLTSSGKIYVNSVPLYTVTRNILGRSGLEGFYRFPLFIQRI
jgi:histone chaperone ASF1